VERRGSQEGRRPLSEKHKERTLVIVKPDGVQRGLVGSILNRFEQKGIKLVGMKIENASRAKAEKHYEEHSKKPFFPRLCRYLCAGPVVPVVLEGEQVVEVVRKMCGSSTDPKKCEGGTIRGDYGFHFRRNIIHSSDCPEEAKKEIGVWFSPEEICNWDQAQSNWINELENAPIDFYSDDDSQHPGHLEGKIGQVNEEMPIMKKKE